MVTVGYIDAHIVSQEVLWATLMYKAIRCKYVTVFFPQGLMVIRTNCMLSSLKA